jgi:methionine sulfoxide reductase heme-binding subunit
VLRIILNKKPVFWLLLSIPALLMLRAYWSGEVIAMDMLHPTGEWSARLMIFAMILSPLVSLIGPRPWLGWLVQRRRSLGVAAFLYGVLHLIFYLIDMGSLKDILAEFWALGQQRRIDAHAQGGLEALAKAGLSGGGARSCPLDIHPQ